MGNHEHESCPACGKKTMRTEEQKKKLLNRLNRIEGQVRGVKKMVENDAYCNDVLMQSAAIAAAVDAFNREMLRAHVHSCVLRDIRAGKDEVADELIDTIERLMR
ncbi:MAG: metal-sensing transcriptional repressor [Clostridia bacterium]|nr:metal-sensing transcriptional repressor [Clostridia bacterium]